ncbi:MAG: VPLPA-CTERM sorting domain-containing protein [Pseudomonadota bacterium]
MSTRVLLAGALAAGLTAAGASAPQAAIITHDMDLTGYGGLGSSFSYSAGDLDLTVTGHLLNADGTIGSLERIGQWSNGLGVLNNDEMRRYCRYRRGKKQCHDYSTDQHFVDGRKNDEVVRFAFSQVVTIEKIWFSYVDRHDDFAFTVIDGGASTHFDAVEDIPGSGRGNGRSVQSFSFGPDFYYSSVFGIGAVENDDQFKIKKIRVSYNDAPPKEDIPVMPLPAGAWLMLSAFGGLALMRRRRKAA